MADHEADFISDLDFSPEERKAFRRLLLDYNRGRWLGKFVARWGAWAMGLLAGLVLFQEQIGKILSWFKPAGG